ncbi:MAG: hypothetical protein MUF48_09405 [Pirellulaceae bacterium]|jgi:hypothetical protein|nr:hypothetical protein [Pirellulaceae bacterium]
MGRAYAGILGPLAFVTVVARCLVRGGDTVAAVGTASVMLFVFSALGYIIGSVAERTVVEALGNQLRGSWTTAERTAQGPDVPSPSSDAAA